jgi:hypothetical protein
LASFYPLPFLGDGAPPPGGSGWSSGTAINAVPGCMGSEKAQKVVINLWFKYF